MNAEFNWWLLLVGVVAGAGLTWLVLADSARRDRDLDDDETAAEAGWIARSLAEDGEAVDPSTAELVLRAHRRYLGLPPPDALVDPAELDRFDASPVPSFDREALGTPDADDRPLRATPSPGDPQEGRRPA